MSPRAVLEEWRSHALQAAAVNAGKLAKALARRAGSGGTSLPGLVSTRLAPSLLQSLARRLPNGCVLVTGTNGKTTTTRIMADAARLAGLYVVSNREGSNLVRGITTELIDHCGPLGTLNVPGNAIGIFEVDEAALVPVARALEPRLLVITNLFRDQLDRYFEVDYIAHLWAGALKELPSTTTVVLNADDPQVAFLGADLRGPVMYYGLEDTRHGKLELEHASDSRRCLRCGTDLQYSLTFFAHLGHYSCKLCGWSRPSPRLTAWKVELRGMEGSSVDVALPWGTQTFEVPLPSLYNVYNTLAATAGSLALGVDAESMTRAVAGATGAFARMERFEVDGKQVCLTLVKNPIGFNESLRFLLGQRGVPVLLLALNDNIPDGRDVSWIWDVDFERWRESAGTVVTAGLRAQDLALRLKYSGMVTRNGDGDGGRLFVEPDIVRAFWQALSLTPPGETLHILPTYTAMWTLRDYLVRQGYLQPFWRRQQ